MIKYFLQILRGEVIEDITADNATRKAADSPAAGTAARSSPNAVDLVCVTPMQRKPMHRVCELTVATLLEVSRLFKSAGQHFSELGAIEVLVKLATEHISRDKLRHHHHHHHQAVHARADADGNSSEGSCDYLTDGSDASQVRENPLCRRCPQYPTLTACKILTRRFTVSAIRSSRLSSTMGNITTAVRRLSSLKISTTRIGLDETAQCLRCLHSAR